MKKQKRTIKSLCKADGGYGSSDFKAQGTLISRLTVRQCKGLAVKTDQRLIDMQKEEENWPRDLISPDASGGRGQTSSQC